MDPFSLAATIITVVDVTKTLLLTCYRIRGQIKGADDEIAQIIADVEALDDTLQELRDILPPEAATLSSSSYAKPFLDGLAFTEKATTEQHPASTAFVSALRACEVVLKDLASKMEPLAKPGLRSKLKWPFEQNTIKEKLGILEKHKGTLQLALTTYQTRMLDEQGNKLDNQHQRSKRTAILTWFKTSDPEQNHKVSRAKHEPTTAQWIFETEAFCSWEASECESLWLYGIPGAGKTILCSLVIDHVLQEAERGQPDVRVAYFYFDFSDSKKQTVANFLKSVVYQLISANAEMPESAAGLYEKCNSGLSEPSLEELVDVIKAEVAQTQRTVLVIDALDELPRDERQLLFETLPPGSLPDNLSLLVTSRKEPDIEAALGPVVTHTVCIQSSVVDADVRVHVEKAIERDARLMRWKQAIRDEILESIVDGARGMFRWAVCQLDTMKKCLTPAMVRAELKRMPATLDQTYDRILQAVPELHQPFVQAALHWLAFANRPLQLRELAEAAAVDPEAGEDFDLEDARLVDDGLILEVCGVLVTSSTSQYKQDSDDWLSDKVLLERGGWVPSWGDGESLKWTIVSLSHFSVKEYIASARLQKGALASYHINAALANAFLAECCLFYLLRFNDGEMAATIDFDQYPLLEYATRNWMAHWKTAGDPKPEGLRLLVERFFGPEGGAGPYVNWLNVWTPDKNAERSRGGFFDNYRRVMKKSADQCPQPLYYAVSLGDLDIVKVLVEQGGADVTAKEGNFESAFGAAAYYGHDALVSYMLEQGADPNQTGSEFGSILQIAALGGSVPVVQRLIDAGSNVNAQGGSHNTALIAAASKEHADVVALLVRHEADITLASRGHGSSLYQAAVAGDIKIATALLAAGADINGMGDSDGTPLCGAALSGSLPLLQMLLRKGADVNQGGSGDFGYPVVAAASKGHSQLVKALVRAGADVNVRHGGGRGTTALEEAITSRSVPTFMAVLDAGANMDAPCNIYVNPFHAAIWTGELDMAKILMARGAAFEDEALFEAVKRYDSEPVFLETLWKRSGLNVDAYSDRDGSLLHIAVNEGNEEVIWLVLNRDPYVNAVAEAGTPLARAVEEGMVDIVTELLRRGADVNRRVKEDSPFDKAIYWACGNGEGDLRIAEMLLEHGADVNGGSGACIRWAVEKEKEDVVRWLVGKGVDLNKKPPIHQNTPLGVAVREKLPNMVDLLLELGADINGPAGDDGTILHCAMLSGDEAMVNHVFEKGAGMDETEGSILVTAISRGMEHLVPLLLERGARLEAPPQYETPAAVALSRNKKETFKMLMERGAAFAESDVDVLMDTIKMGSLEDVKEILDYGMDPNWHTTYQAAIEEAASTGKPELVDLLMDYGADVNDHADGRRTGLSAACSNGDIAMVQHLLERGADANAFDKNSGYPLYSASAKAGNLAMVDLLLEHGADVTLHDGECFAQAAFGGEKMLARLLREVEGRPEVRLKCLDHALQGAAHWCRLDVCVWLLAQGADASYVGGKWGCPLTAAITNIFIYDPSGLNNRRLIVDTLLAEGASVNPTPVASSNRLTSASASDSDSDTTLPTPLTAALLRSGGAPMAKAFLAAGADPNVPGGKFGHPLQTAAVRCPSMLRPLLDAGADVTAIDTGDSKHGTALNAAAWAHDVASIKLLLDAGADPNAVGGKYGTPLQSAAKRDTNVSGGWTATLDSLAAIKALVAAGADPHASGAGKYGSAMQMAAKSGNLAVVKFLVEEVGVDVEVKGGRYGSVRQAAVAKERWGVVTYLEKEFGKFAWEGYFDQYGKWKGRLVRDGEVIAESWCKGPTNGM